MTDSATGGCTPTPSKRALICVIDDDEGVRGGLASFLRSSGYEVRAFGAPSEFLACPDVDDASCLVLDIRLENADGLEFQQELIDNQVPVPVILITGHGDIPMTVKAMKAGAVDFLPKPFEEDQMLTAIQMAVERDATRRTQSRHGDSARACYNSLTSREQEVLGLVTAGLMNKQVAGRLGLSEITVKIHRGNMMRKMQAQSLADLVRMAETLGVREAGAHRFSNQT